jgi:hypothetical protein
MFRRRRDWFQHDLDVHRLFWECPRGCSPPLTSKHDFKLHMLHSHQTQLREEQIQNLAKAMSKQQDGRHQTSCGLCGAEYLVNETLRRHLGGEMEEIALFVMPRQHDFWDGSDGSSDTDSSHSPDELIEEPTSSGITEADTLCLAKNTSKEGAPAANITPDSPEQRGTHLEKQAHQVDDALKSIDETSPIPPGNTQEEAGSIPIKAAAKSDSPAPEGEFRIPKDSPDPSCDEPLQEEFKNPAVGSEPPVRNQTSTLETSTIPTSLLPEMHVILRARSLDDLENGVGSHRSFGTDSRPTFVADKSPEITCRTEFQNNFVPEFDQDYDYRLTNSEFAWEGVPEDTLSYRHAGLGMSPGQAQGSSENDHPTFKAPLESPPSPVSVLRIHIPEAIPSSPASPFTAYWRKVPTAQSDPVKRQITADTFMSPGLGSEPSSRLPALNLDGNQRLEVPGTAGSGTMGISMEAPHPSAAGAFRCHHPGCVAPPFQTKYLLDSHTNIHSSSRPHYCPVPDCPRSIGGKGFKRNRDMIRHGLVHESPGYVCPFCTDQQHKYPRRDNLQMYSFIYFEDSRSSAC